MTAVRNLTTDNAPTKPKDRANDDLTTAINADTDKVTRSIEFEYEDLEEREFEYR